MLRLPFKTLSRVFPYLPPSLPSLLLPPFLLSPLSSARGCPRRVPPLRLRPIQRDKGEDAGGFPGSASSQAGGEPQCSRGKLRLIPSPAFLLRTKNTRGRQSALCSLPPCFLPALLPRLSSPLLVLQGSVCKQIPAHVIRCLHHSSTFTAPSFLPSLFLPPRPCPPFASHPSGFFRPSTTPPPFFPCSCRSSCKADDKQAWVDAADMVVTR